MKKRILTIIVFWILLMISTILTLKILKMINFECIYKKIFNIYCAGCGTTRMIKAILNFELIKAFTYNPVMFILLILVLILLIYDSIIYIKSKKLYIPKIKTIITTAIMLIIYMILRNIPAFNFLAP